MWFSPEPAARPRIGPAFKLHLKHPHLAPLQPDLRSEDTVLRAAPGDDLVGARRQNQLRLSARIKMHPAAGQTIERTEGREELAILPLQRHLRSDRRLVRIAHLQAQQGDLL